MKVKLSLCKEIVVDVKDDKALKELDKLYHSNDLKVYGTVSPSLIEEATRAVEKASGVPAFKEEYPETDVICGVYNMDGTAILEW